MNVPSPLIPNEPPDTNQEWLLYQQRVAQQLAGEPPAALRAEADDTRRIPPQPLDEMQLNELHAASQIQPSQEAGTMVTDYVGAAPHASFAIPAPAPIVPFETEIPQPLAATDRVLPWAKRLAFALLGAFIGSYIFWTGGWLYLSGLMPNITMAGVALLLAFIMRNRSNYAKYGAIAVTMTLLLPIALFVGHEAYSEAGYLLQDPYLNNPNLPASRINELLTSIARENNLGLFFSGTGFGMGLLAAFAVLRSQRAGAATIGLLFIVLAAIFGLAVSNSSTMSSLANILIIAMPLMLILLYGMSWGRRGDNPPPDPRH